MKREAVPLPTEQPRSTVVARICASAFAAPSPFGTYTSAYAEWETHLKQFQYLLPARKTQEATQEATQKQ